MPIGCKATMRNRDTIKEFLTSAFECRDNIIPSWNFDKQGNLSFGVRDYTDFPGQKYDPEIGIYGMDITVVVERPGHRVSRRRRAKSKVGDSHIVTPDESREWFVEQYNISILEE
jgi:large subunit ribosomal protein L5